MILNDLKPVFLISVIFTSLFFFVITYFVYNTQLFASSQRLKFGSVEGSRDELNNLDPIEAWNYLKQHTRDADSVLYNFDPTSELRTSIKGSYFNPLSGYRNPCWIASIKDSNVYGSHESRYAQKSWAEMHEILNNRTASGEYWRIRCFPYAMLIGMSKSGTTDLYVKSIRHPEIFSAAVKETKFWGRYRMRFTEEEVLESPANLTYYMDFFDNAAESIRLQTETGESGVFHPGITMDGTPHYMWDYSYWNLMPGNRGKDEPTFLLPHTLYALAPKLKFLVILRKPTDRYYSKFRMVNPGGNEHHFHESVERVVKLWKDCLENMSERACTHIINKNEGSFQSADGKFGLISAESLGPGMYHILLEDWLKIYPKSQFLILKAEDYYDHLTDTLSKVFKFLGVRDLSAEEMEDVTRGSIYGSLTKSPDMLPETRRLLDEVYEPVNTKLAELLDDPAFTWA